MALNNGTILRNTYRIVRTLGAGGFGITYEVVHEGLDTRMAVKEFFVSDFCNRDDSTGRVSVATKGKEELIAKLKKKFVDEARSLSKLHHPHIVKVTDVFEENDTVYFVMNYIEGRSLADHVAGKGTLSEAKAIEYVRQICDALSYVHSNNRMHLDVKPANVMIDGDDNAVLIDFGASKQYDEVNGQNTSTVAGFTPGFAPIEQMGNDITEFTPATDVYAVGATLYRLLTGQTPPNASLLVSKPLPALPANISEATRSAIIQAMRPSKTDRPQTIAAFLSLLPSGKNINKAPKKTERETIVAQVENPTVAFTRKKSKNKTALYVSLGIIAAVAIGVIWAVSTNEPTPPPVSPAEEVIAEDVAPAVEEEVVEEIVPVTPPVATPAPAKAEAVATSTSKPSKQSQPTPQKSSKPNNSSNSASSRNDFAKPAPKNNNPKSDAPRSTPSTSSANSNPYTFQKPTAD